MHSKAIRGAVTVAALGVLVGCTQDYLPAAPHQSVRPGLAARVDAIGLEPPLTVWMSVHGIQQVRVRRILLSPAASMPCREGVRDAESKLDGQLVWARPFEVAGRHHLVVRFSPGASSDLLTKPAALDLVLAVGPGPDECLRVELTGAEPALAWQREVVGSGGGSIRILAPVDSVNGVDSGWSFDARIGGYAGPLRLMGEIGIGGAHCDEDCHQSDFGFLWLPLGVSAHWFAFESGQDVLDLGLAYRFTQAVIRGAGSGRTAIVHGPEFRIRLGETLERGPGLPAGARIASAGYEFFAAEWFGRGPSGPEKSFVLGLGIVSDVGF
jgi:hypothetical protein